MKTIVLNGDGAIDSLESLQLLIASIFKMPVLTPSFVELSNGLWQQKELLTSHAAVSEALRVIFSEHARNMPSNALLPHLLKQLAEHDATTQSNRNAYGHLGLLNPTATFWPDPKDPVRPRSIYDELPYAQIHAFIDRDTPIGSAGSCFAMEIAHRLQADGYNYVVTESATRGDHGYSDSCAAWGTIFNVPAFRQLVEKAFGIRKLPSLIWSTLVDGKLEYRDPFREDIGFESIAAYEANISAHIAAAKAALLKTKVFIITLGLNEVWYLKSDGSVFSRNLWGQAPSLVQHKVLSVEDNLNELQRMLDTWRQFNPDIKLIVSVSPVPMHATFRGAEMHVAAATGHSKATLRVAAELFANQNRDVYYFPSFETVMYCTDAPWQADQRHVARHTVANVMRLFQTMFVAKDDSPVKAAEHSDGNHLDRAAFCQSILRQFQHPEAKQDFNLIRLYLDATAPSGAAMHDKSSNAGLEIFYAMLDVRNLDIREKFEAKETLFLCSRGVHDYLVSTDGCYVAQADILRRGQADQYANLCFPAYGEHIISAHSAKTVESYDASLNETPLRESMCFQLAPLLGHIMSEVFGMAGYVSPKVQSWLNSLATAGKGFAVSQHTEQSAYMNMLSLHEASNALSNDFMSFLNGLYLPPYEFQAAQGVLGAMPAERSRQIVEKIAEDGFFVFDELINAELCDRLVAYAENREWYLSGDGVDAAHTVRLDRRKPLAERYMCTESLSSPDIQDLVADLSILEVSQNYLGCRPVLSSSGIYYSVPFKNDASSEAAQLFHWDMDRVKWLKWFIYLTDVTLDTGPHTVVRKTHRRDHKPMELLQRGYARIPDDDIERYHPKSDWMNITGRRGTIFAVDTRAWHRGLKPEIGERMIVQLEFCNSLIGGAYKKNEVIPILPTNTLSVRIQKFPQIYNKYS